MKQFAEILSHALLKREPVSLCTVVETSGSTPLKAGAKMLVWENGNISGTIGGGNIEKKVIATAMETYHLGRPKLEEYALLKEKMCCGGSMKIFFEPMRPRNQLIIFGAGHIGSNLTCFADHLDFKIIIVDERKEYISNIRQKGVKKLNAHHDQAFSKIIFDKYTYISICTHSHQYDREILSSCINRPHAYLGMIGSRRKVMVTRKAFLHQSIATQEQLDQVDMPMGFDIGRKDPAEIALGIIAKIVALSNNKSIPTAEQATTNTNNVLAISEACLNIPLLNEN